MDNEHFWSKVDKSGECWMWTSSRNAAGYGVYRNKAAHRYAYILEHGYIPAGLVVRHICDNRACVRPSHLVIGTYKENSEDMIARGRGRRAVRKPMTIDKPIGLSIPKGRQAAFALAVEKLRRFSPLKSMSAVIEDAVMEKAASLPDLSPSFSEEQLDDMAVRDVIARLGKPTARDLQTRLPRMGRKAIDAAVGRLIEQGMVKATKTKRTTHLEVAE